MLKQCTKILPDNTRSNDLKIWITINREIKIKKHKTYHSKVYTSDEHNSNYTRELETENHTFFVCSCTVLAQKREKINDVLVSYSRIAISKFFFFVLFYFRASHCIVTILLFLFLSRLITNEDWIASTLSTNKLNE